MDDGWSDDGEDGVGIPLAKEEAMQHHLAG